MCIEGLSLDRRWRSRSFVLASFEAHFSKGDIGDMLEIFLEELTVRGPVLY